MFGTLRLVLALMVVHSHFTGGGLTGPIAVFGFFCLSGYLMTKIVNETYSDGLVGYLRFLCNRILRIYPAYFAAAAFAILVLLLWPGEARTAAGWYMLPPEWLPSVTIIGLQPRSPILVIPAWSLHVELIYYILIGAVLGRSRLLTSLWFLCSLAMPIVAIVRGDFSFDWLYFTPYGSSAAFATGAMIHQFRDRLPALSPILAAMSYCALVGLGLTMPLEIAASGGMYVSLILTALAIVALKNVPPPRWDTMLGDLAYPVFLMHIPCRAAMYGLLGRANGWVDLIAIGVTFALSYLIVSYVERPVSQIRAKLRSADATGSKKLLAWRQAS
jgi:peptidoglycan/LPS O-acetylase OafA/YrhL